MAKRRSRKNEPTGCVLVVVAFVIVAALGKAFEAQQRAHPLYGQLELLAAVLVAVGVGVGWWQRRKRNRAAAAQEHRLRVARSTEIAPYRQMNAKEFERALGFLCERDGCTQVRVVGGGGDLGADVLAVAPDGRLIVLQAKRYAPTTKVSGPDLQKFGGTCFAVHQAQVAAVVTTSVYTKQAREYAQLMGIRLFDGDALAGWASRTGPAPWH